MKLTFFCIFRFELVFCFFLVSHAFMFVCLFVCEKGLMFFGSYPTFHLCPSLSYRILRYVMVLARRMVPYTKRECDCVTWVHPNTCCFHVPLL